MIGPYEGETVESVVRWINGSNCKADWAWDIVRYIWYVNPFQFVPPIHQRHSWNNLRLLRRQIYVNWRLAGERRGGHFLIMSLSGSALERKLYLWLSLLCSIWWSSVNYLSALVSSHRDQPQTIVVGLGCCCRWPQHTKSNLYATLIKFSSRDGRLRRSPLELIRTLFA